jgi:hypothetical protein
MVAVARLLSGVLGSALSATVLCCALWALQSATGPAKEVAEKVSTSFSLPKVESANVAPPSAVARRAGHRNLRSR